MTFTPGSGITSNLLIRRNNRVVTVYGYLTSTSAFGENQLLGTVESGNLPADTCRFVAGVANQAYSVGDIAYCAIGTNGEIRITAKSGNTYKVCYFSASYIVQT